MFKSSKTLVTTILKDTLLPTQTTMAAAKTAAAARTTMSSMVSWARIMVVLVRALLLLTVLGVSASHVAYQPPAAPASTRNNHHSRRSADRYCGGVGARPSCYQRGPRTGMTALPSSSSSATFAAESSDLSPRRRAFLRQIIATTAVASTASAAGLLTHPSTALASPYCAQGVGDGCDALADDNDFVRTLQERSAANRERYSKVRRVCCCCFGFFSVGCGNPNEPCTQRLISLSFFLPFLSAHTNRKLAMPFT